MTIIHQSQIVSYGSEAVETIEAGYLITFGEGAPDALADYCFLLKPEENNGEVKPGMNLAINDANYEVTAVGSVAGRNLKELGHMTLHFDGAASPFADGTVHVSGNMPSSIQSGDVITISTK